MLTDNNTWHKLALRQYRRTIQSKEVSKMQDFKDMVNEIENEKCLGSTIKELEKVNKQLSKLTLRKEELTDMIISGMKHNHAGQRT